MQFPMSEMNSKKQHVCEQSPCQTSFHYRQQRPTTDQICSKHRQLKLSQPRTISVSWCFEPGQPQRVTSGLNTNFSLPPSYSFPKLLYQKPFSFFQTPFKFYPEFRNAKPEKTITHILEAIYISRALNRVT